MEKLKETDFVTARFGSKWREWADETLNKKEIIEIAFSNGRRVVLLEREIDSLLDEKINRFVELKTKNEFYNKLDAKLDLILNAELEVDDYQNEIYHKRVKINTELENLIPLIEKYNHLIK